MRSRLVHSFRLWFLILWVVVQVFGAPALAQDGPTPTAVATETPSATPTLPSVSEMMTNVESTLQLLAKVDARLNQVLYKCGCHESGSSQRHRRTRIAPAFRNIRIDERARIRALMVAGEIPLRGDQSPERRNKWPSDR